MLIYIFVDFHLFVVSEIPALVYLPQLCTVCRLTRLHCSWTATLCCSRSVSVTLLTTVWGVVSVCHPAYHCLGCGQCHPAYHCLGCCLCLSPCLPLSVVWSMSVTLLTTVWGVVSVSLSPCLPLSGVWSMSVTLLTTVWSVVSVCHPAYHCLGCGQCLSPCLPLSGVWSVSVTLLTTVWGVVSVCHPAYHCLGCGQCLSPCLPLSGVWSVPVTLLTTVW